jgi:hypothetical protein
MRRLPAAARQFPSRLLLGTTAAALAATTMLSGCGSSAKASGPVEPTLSPVLQGDPTQVVAASAGRTVGSGKAGIAETVPVFQEGKLASVNGEGTIDFAQSRLRLAVPNAQKAEERQFGRTLFVLLPEQAGPALGGKKWVKVDLDHTTSTSPDPFNLYAFDPKQLLIAVTAVNEAKIVGSEDVRNTHTTHFTGSIDPTKVASSGVGSTFATEFTKATKGAPTPVDVWLDDAGLVRRMSLNLAPPDATLPAGSAPTATVELFDYGTADVSFPQPPASEVAELKDLGGLTSSGD